VFVRVNISFVKHVEGASVGNLQYDERTQQLCKKILFRWQKMDNRVYVAFLIKKATCQYAVNIQHISGYVHTLGGGGGGGYKNHHGGF
jgi:hypothetical protein